jgi:hypothetical protein
MLLNNPENHEKYQNFGENRGSQRKIRSNCKIPTLSVPHGASKPNQAKLQNGKNSFAFVCSHCSSWTYFQFFFKVTNGAIKNG